MGEEVLGPIFDTWFQTETGSIMIAQMVAFQQWRFYGQTAADM